MKNYVIATSAGIITATFEDSEMDANVAGAVVVLELKPKASQLALRYGLKEGKIVDLFPGKSDDEVVKAVEVARDAAVVTAKASFKIASNDFLRFLGAGRRVAIRQLAKDGDAIAEDFLDMFNRVQVIDSQDGDLKSALAYLQTKGEVFAGVVDDFYATGHTFVS